MGPRRDDSASMLPREGKGLVFCTVVGLWCQNVIVHQHV
jgi:hypothetical protein